MHPWVRRFTVLIFRKLIEKHCSVDRSAVTALSGIRPITECSFDVRFVFIPKRKRPNIIAAFLAQFSEMIFEVLIFRKEHAGTSSEGDRRRSGKCCNINNKP